MEKLQKVIISGGGTGGHIFPGIAIAEALQKLQPGIAILFVGAKGKMEMEKVPKAGYNIKGLPIAGFNRKLFVFSNLKLPFKMIASVLKARKILKDFKPQLVIGVGGYASAATCYVAGKAKLPVVLQEQNAYAGKSNRFLAKYAKKICVAYDGMEQYFPKHKLVLTGNPVRKNIEKSTISTMDAVKQLGFKHNYPICLIVGGSLGALAINKAVKKALNNWKTLPINFFWQTGKSYWPVAEESVLPGMENVKVKAFINNMEVAYAAASLVVSRAGAIALAELSIAKKPAILVPLPTAAEDHQTKNALKLQQKNAALLLKNSEVEEKLETLVPETIKNTGKLNTFSDNIVQFAKPNAAQTIAKEAIKAIN